MVELAGSSRACKSRCWTQSLSSQKLDDCVENARKRDLNTHARIWSEMRQEYGDGPTPESGNACFE